jgi:hypothetical protein
VTLGAVNSFEKNGYIHINYLSSQNFMHYLNCTPSPKSQSTALLDSGYTVHFLLANTKCTKKSLASTPLEVSLPNGSTIASTHNAMLNMPSLPHVTRQTHILPGLAQHSLLSVGKIYDSGCAVRFTSTEAAVKNGATIILTGQMDTESGLWRYPLENSIPLQRAPEYYAHNLYEYKSI